MAVFSDDNLLYRAFQQGSSDAERQVFSRFFKPACIYAGRMIGEIGGAQDIVIESFQKCWERRERLPSINDFSRFLYVMVRNACTSAIRSDRIHKGAYGQIGFLQGQDGVDEDINQREILRAELLRDIYEEIEELPDRCRAVFKLVFVQGLGTEEIARRLGMNVQTVRTQKARAISLIRSRLLKKGRILTILLLYALLK
jgi:RNA polymerase sigma-70 factor (family 1)